MAECPQELCPYWPGEGCARAFAPCDEAAEDQDKERAWRRPSAIGTLGAAFREDIRDDIWAGWGN